MKNFVTRCCINCGAEIQGNAMLCPACDAKLNNKNQNDNSVSDAPNVNNTHRIDAETIEDKPKFGNKKFGFLRVSLGSIGLSIFLEALFFGAWLLSEVGKNSFFADMYSFFALLGIEIISLSASLALAIASIVKKEGSIFAYITLIGYEFAFCAVIYLMLF